MPVLSPPQAAQTPPPALAPEPAQVRIILQRNYAAAVIALAAIFLLCVGIYVYQRTKGRS